MAFHDLAIIIALVAIAGTAFGQDIVIEGIRLTNWGAWGAMETCLPGSYVYGMRLKVHSDQGFFGDNSALNGIELLCINAAQKRPARNASIDQFTTISSLIGHLGSVGGILECPDPGFVVGFQLRSEEDQGIFSDDTAANNLKLVCSGLQVLEGYGHSWGSWTQQLNCPRGLKVCGIQTQVEGPTDDDSTLNNVNMGCCA